MRNVHLEYEHSVRASTCHRFEAYQALKTELQMRSRKGHRLFSFEARHLVMPSSKEALYNF